ncbi:MAG: replication and repair protein RecF, partial [Gaiellaceae bacterium]|nr:replication and repair protein RecF [Gaiellaceae bacterium]
LELALEPGLVLVVGRNGVGKTNLLEALHVATQGFSPRTRAEGELIRFGAAAGRIALRGSRGPTPIELELTLRRGEGKVAKLNGAPLRAAEQLRAEVATLVFTPDRLAVVKAGPAARRAYFDRVLGRLFPARAELPIAYGAALGQRNAALRRVGLGVSDRETLAPWTAQVAVLGAELQEARRAVLAELAPLAAARADELGLPGVALEHSGAEPTVEELERRLPRDLERGATSVGPHLDEIVLRAGDRELRSYGSQGEQRLTVLALLLAEAELIQERRGIAPLLLLDDVLSELDPGRREQLALRLERLGQTVVTATTAGALPRSPAQLLEVTPGAVVTR